LCFVWGGGGGGGGPPPPPPGLLAIWIAPGIVVQVGHGCPAVKVERPMDERP
jgi:hypothetical protein